MSPTGLNDDNRQSKREVQALKINKESHLIRKPSSSSSSSSSSSPSSLSNAVAVASRPQQQRHPVIIYTHSPKIIHTHPKDFMALVQKLTGLSQSGDDMASKNNNESWTSEDDSKHGDNKGIMNEDNDSTSVVTDENSSFGDVPVNSSCFVPPIFDTSNPTLMSHHIPIFSSSQPFPNYSDCLFFPPNVRLSVSSSTDFQEF
ncbi:VQ protein [Dillenia turbinata]|uniref:VQ protein n=1 Tax=Dillenia turbinata TaxID=194707 RepID=A0AAN8Z557_9MAGN